MLSHARALAVNFCVADHHAYIASLASLSLAASCVPVVIRGGVDVHIGVVLVRQVNDLDKGITHFYIANVRRLVLHPFADAI